MPFIARKGRKHAPNRDLKAQHLCRPKYHRAAESAIFPNEANTASRTVVAGVSDRDHISGAHENNP
jgi:hypothetical protein